MNRFIFSALVALLTFSIGVGCGSLWKMRHYSNTHSTIALAKPQIPSDTFISLERTGCYGSCPTYTVAISADGTVVFTGSYFPKVNGKGQWTKSGVIKSRLSDEQLRQLVAQFDQANYFSLQDFYRDEKDGCPTYWTDMSTAYTSIQINGRQKRVEHYLGCTFEGSAGGTYPTELGILETAIDQIVNTKQWMQ